MHHGCRHSCVPRCDRVSRPMTGGYCPGERSQCKTNRDMRVFLSCVDRSRRGMNLRDSRSTSPNLSVNLGASTLVRRSNMLAHSPRTEYGQAFPLPDDNPPGDTSVPDQTLLLPDEVRGK